MTPLDNLPPTKIIAATDAGAKAGGPRIMSARDLGAETTDDLLTTRDATEPTVPADDVIDAPPSAEASVQEIGQQPLALKAPSLNTIIEQAVGNVPAMTTSTGLGIPDFLSPGVSSISGIFGGIALGGLAAGGSGGSAGIFSAAGVSSSVLGGRLVNGYISGARVYQDQDNDGVFDYDDANSNGAFDDGEELEPYALTSGDGSYELTIVSGGGSLIAEPLAGTVDQSTGATVTSQFSAPSGATVISPVSTLVDAGLSESQVKTALDIDSSIDILNFDPVSEALYGDDPDKALGFKSASVLVSNLLDVGSEIIAGAAGSTDNFSDQIVSGIVGLIRESGSSPVDLSDADTVGSALTKAATAAQSSGVAIDPSASSFTDTVTGMKTQIATANAAVKTALRDNAGSPEAALKQIAAVEAATQNSLATKARAVAKGDETVESLGSFDLDSEISSVFSNIPDVIRPLVSSTEPERGESGVISIYSDAYTAATTTTWTLSGSGQIDDKEITTGSGDTSKKVSGADDLVTLTLNDAVDASRMTALNFSVWRSMPKTDFSILLTDTNGDGYVKTFRSEDEPMNGGQWNDLEIQLPDMSTYTDISTIQFGSWKEDGTAAEELFYLDNIYFSKNFTGLGFGESYLVTDGIEGAFIPPIVQQSDGNSILGMLKGGVYSHVVLSTGNSNDQPTIDPVDLNDNAVLGMWVHAEGAGSEIRIQLGDSASGGWPNDQNYTEAMATTTQAGWNFLTFNFNTPAERFVANGATNGSQGYTAATRFDPDVTYDTLSIFPDLSSESAIGRSYYFDALAPYTGTTPPVPLAVAGTGTGDGSEQPAFTGFDFEGASEDYNLVGFQGAEDKVVLAEDPEDASNTVIQFTKTTDAKYFAGVQLGVGDSETVGPINFDIANDQTAISARIWSPEAGKVVRMEVGDSIFGGVVDINWVQAEATLTEAGWNDVVFDFSSPVERYISSYGRPSYTPLSDTVTYDRVSIFLDWENGDEATPLVSDTVYYIDNVSGPGAGLSGGYTVPDGYVLAFEDNFDDINQGPDPEYWTFDLGDGTDQGIPGWGNNELQNYQRDLDNVKIVDVGVADGDTDGSDDGVNGALRITAKRDGDGITSARVKSDIDYLPAYGYYEIRAKLPSEDGAWPAIWLLGDVDSGTWPAIGEIDMVEWSSAYEGDSDVTITHALHATNFNSGGAKGWKGDIDSRIDDWHTYQLWWTPDVIKMGVDGGVLDAHFTYNKPSAAGNADWPYDDPMDIIMNVAIGGNLGGTHKVPSSSFNYEMYVDYVRVYQTPPVPTAAPAAPDEPEDGVVALTSNTFTIDTPSNWRTDDSVNSTVTDLVLSGDTVKQYTTVNQFTIEPSTPLDVSGAYKFQFSIYRTDPYADLSIKLVDFGADGLVEGDDSEHTLVFSQAGGNAISSGQWTPVEVLMTDLTGLTSSSAIGQIVVSSQKTQDGETIGSGETIYLSDIFFSPPPAPTSGPTAPDDPSSYVISLFSDASGYDSLDSTSWSSDTDQVTVEPPITFGDGNTVKKYTDLSFVEIEPAAVIDATLMDTIKFDVWRTSDTAELKLKLIDYGADGAAAEAGNTGYEIALTAANGYPANAVGSWTHIDVPLSQMTELGSVANIGKIVISSHEPGGTAGAGETLYLDNLYLSRPAPPVDINFELDDSSGFDIDYARASLRGADLFELRDSPVLAMPGTVGYLKNNNTMDESGMSLLELGSNGSLISPGNETVSMKVFFFEENVKVTLRLEDITDDDYVELPAITGEAREAQTLSWDFGDAAGLDHGNNYSKASVYFDITHPAVFFDDIQFNGAVLGE